jgi:hypothetical protein
VKAMDAVKNLNAAAKNPPAYGAWNVQIVTTGTGEALPGPVTCVLSSEKRIL